MRTNDKDMRKAIKEARVMVDDVAKLDGNEAETRRRIERIFESVLGYDAFKHITREHAVHGVGDSEYCDFAIRLETSAKPIVMVEIKRAGVDLETRHLKQTASYAINVGCEWALLTNAKEWRLYHISFNQPPETTLIESWNLTTDELDTLGEKFNIVSYRFVKLGGLTQIWQKRNILSPRNVLAAILSQNSLSMLRSRLKRSAAVPVSPEEIVAAFRRLLNENALAELEQIKITLPPKKKPVLKAPAKAEIAPVTINSPGPGIECK